MTVDHLIFVHSIIMLPLHSPEVLVNVHCVVVKTAIVPVVKKRRLLPEPQTIQMILDGTGDSEKCAESVVCNSCYLFCKKLLQQYGDHINSSERIIDSPNVKVGYLRSQVHEC